MHAQRLLHNYFKKSCAQVHKKRLASLMRVSKSLLSRGKLTLTSLGRHLSGSSAVKHKIKLIDRLLGNRQLYSERLAIYQAMAQKIIGTLTSIQLLIGLLVLATPSNCYVQAWCLKTVQSCSTKKCMRRNIWRTIVFIKHFFNGYTG